MKKIASLIVLIIGITIFINGCSSFSDKAILKGYIDKEEYFDKEGFQDYTDYCKYYYEESNNLFLESNIYSGVTEYNLENIRSYFTNFESWMDSSDRSDEYDFDDSCISEGDYIYIKTKEWESSGDSKYTKFADYNVYFYDTESATLFYIHSNI